MHVEQQLAQYGAVGVLLAVFVALFLWMFRQLFSRFLTHLDFLQTAFKELIVALQKLSDKVDDNHKEVMGRISSRKDRIPHQS